ncbi:MAG: hypothetical protein ACRCZ0_12460 [Cetobacterium sp.]
MAKNTGIEDTELQSKNKYLTITINNKKYQFKPTTTEDGIESVNGVLTGKFTELEIKILSSYDGVLRTK